MLGGSQTFLAMGLFVAGYTVLFSILHLIINKYCKRPHQKEKGESLAMVHYEHLLTVMIYVRLNQVDLSSYVAAEMPRKLHLVVT